jgi:hypothetical protein
MGGIFARLESQIVCIAQLRLYAQAHLAFDNLGRDN